MVFQNAEWSYGRRRRSGMAIGAPPARPSGWPGCRAGCTRWRGKRRSGPRSRRGWLGEVAGQLEVGPPVPGAGVVAAARPPPQGGSPTPPLLVLAREAPAVSLVAEPLGAPGHAEEAVAVLRRAVGVQRDHDLDQGAPGRVEQGDLPVGAQRGLLERQGALRAGDGDAAVVQHLQQRAQVVGQVLDRGLVGPPGGPASVRPLPRASAGRDGGAVGQAERPGQVVQVSPSAMEMGPKRSSATHLRK